MSEIQKCPNMVRGGGSTYFILFPFHTIHLALLLFTGVCSEIYWFRILGFNRDHCCHPGFALFLEAGLILL